MVAVVSAIGVKRRKGRTEEVLEKKAMFFYLRIMGNKIYVTNNCSDCLVISNGPKCALRITGERKYLPYIFIAHSFNMDLLNKALASGSFLNFSFLGFHFNGLFSW